MVHVPKVRPEQRTEVPELAAAAAVGSHDAATSSQSFQTMRDRRSVKKPRGLRFS